MRELLADAKRPDKCQGTTKGIGLGTAKELA
jgi:hypothetical protein